MNKTSAIKGMINIGDHPTENANIERSFKFRLVIGLILAIISGVMLTLAFSPYNQWYLIFIAFIPMVIAQYRILPSKYSALASGTTNMIWLALYFGPMFFFVEGAPIYMKLLPVIGFLLAILTEGGFRRFQDKTGNRWLVMHGVVNWIWFEFIRTLIPGLGTWGFVGYTLWNQRWLIFPISVVGIYGLSFLIMMINYSLSTLVISLLDKKIRFESIVLIPPKTVKMYMLISSVLLLIWTGSSLVIKNSRESEIANQSTVDVTVIQPGTTQVAFSHPDMDKEERLTLLTEMTLKTQSFSSDLIVWPELVLNFDPEYEFTEEIRALAETMGAYIVLPYGLLEDGEMRNELKILSPEGRFFPLYSKIHPVTFAGEKRGPNWGAFPVHETSFGMLGAIICYDLNYTDVSRVMAKNGSQIIAVPSNDWPGIVEKQNIHLIFRAIENNVSFVKAETAYDSTVISPLGEIIEETISYEPVVDVINAEVKLGGTEPTIYSRLGDVVGIAMFILGFGFMWMESFVNKKKKNLV